MGTRRIVLTGAALVLAVLLVACGAAETEQPPAAESSVAGTEWMLISLSGSGLIEGTEITLSFTDTSIEGSAGCNTYGGSYTATEDSLRLSDLYWTEMGCMEPEGILDQEMAYLNALGTVDSFQQNAGRLELYDQAGTLILEFGPQRSALTATLEAQESLPNGAVVNVKFTLTNTSAHGFFVLKWFTPLEGLAGDIFQVRRDGEELPYVGKLVKRGAPVSEDYVWIDAGGSVSAEIDLAEGYDFSQAGQYTLLFRSPRLSHAAETLEQKADSVDELMAIRIRSEPVSVTVGAP
jgi:heat shock protein HslJ